MLPSPECLWEAVGLDFYGAVALGDGLQCLTDAPDGDCGFAGSVGVTLERWLCGEGGVQGTTAVVRSPKAQRGRLCGVVRPLLVVRFMGTASARGCLAG